VVLRLRTTSALRSVRLTLRRGSRTVGSRRISRVSGTKRLTLRTRSRLRAGTYRLRLTALDGSGRRVTVTRSLRVRSR